MVFPLEMWAFLLPLWAPKSIFLPIDSRKTLTQLLYHVEIIPMESIRSYNVLKQDTESFYNTFRILIMIAQSHESKRNK